MRRCLSLIADSLQSGLSLGVISTESKPIRRISDKIRSLSNERRILLALLLAFVAYGHLT